ncbi:MAG: hypothetical protein ACJ74G_24010 [Blastocatellia bacterium]
MSAKSLVKPFVFSLVIFPAIFAAAMSLKGAAAGTAVTLTLFAATVLVEVFAVAQFVRARRAFAAGDPGYVTWTLIVVFMTVRLVAEARLLTLSFNLLPEYHEGASAALFFYIVVLRYLYTASDVLFVGALLTTIRSYKSTGLPFKLLPIDYFYVVALCALPVVTFIFRGNLIRAAIANPDGYMMVYRLVAVSVGAVIASLCIVVRRYASQMGGGAVARVWNMVVVAGVARDGSFLALALLSGWSKPAATFVEQYLLWTFACCWLMAALYQGAIFARAAEPTEVALAETVA